MRVRIVRAAIGLACLPAAAGAQTLTLTELQALSRLSGESPRVQAVRSAVDVARADVLSARRWPNPRVTFNRETVAGVTENMFTVSQPLPITGRRRLEVEAASLRVDATASRSDDQIRRLRGDLRQAFTALWLAQMRERELTHSRDRLRDLTVILERREAAGEAAGFDRLRAEREVIDIDSDRSAAAAERMRAQATLVSFFAAPVEGPIELLGSIADATPLPSVEELLMRAEHRAAFVALDHELEAASLAERAAARRVVPEPEVVAGSKSSSTGTGDIGSIVSVHVSLPLFDRAQPEKAAAAARAVQVRAEANALKFAVRAEIVALRAVVLERRTTAAQYRQAVIANVDQIEHIAQVSYEAGERGILELLDAYRTTATARVRQAALDAAVREAEIELEFASGWDLP